MKYLFTGAGKVLWRSEYKDILNILKSSKTNFIKTLETSNVLEQNVQFKFAASWFKNQGVNITKPTKVYKIQGDSIKEVREYLESKYSQSSLEFDRIESYDPEANLGEFSLRYKSDKEDFTKHFFTLSGEVNYKKEIVQQGKRVLRPRKHKTDHLSAGNNHTSTNDHNE